MGKLPGGQLFYGWVVVGVVFSVFVLQSGTRASFGVFYVALIDDLGWSHAATAAAFSMSIVVTSLSAIAIGLAMDRLGPRRVMPVGALVAAAGLALTSQIGQLWQFYAAYGMLVAVGSAGVGFAGGARLISSWFRRRRGTALGLAMAGMGIGSMVVVPIAQYAIEQLGWRAAYVLIGGATVLLAPVIALLIREHPDELGLRPDDDPTPLGSSGAIPPARSTEDSASESSQFRQPAFWLLIGGAGCIGVGIMLNVHQVAYLVDRGFSPFVAASAVGASGLLAAVGQLSAGAISDHLGRRRPLFTAAGLFTVGVASLLAVRGPGDGWLLMLYTILYGLSWGGMNTVAGTIETDLLHGKRLGFLLGFTSLAFTSVGAISTWLAGAVRDQSGSYGLIFALSGGFIVLSAVCYSLALAAGDRHRAAAEPAVIGKQA